MDIPFHVQEMAKLIPVSDQKGNLSEGEILYGGSELPLPFNYQEVSCIDGFVIILRYISNGFVKCIGKFEAQSIKPIRSKK